MRIEKNIARIRALTKQNEDGNWRFRGWIKGCRLQEERIDAVVHRLSDAVAAEIDCRECGHCCTVLLPVLSTADVSRLARHLCVSEAEFARAHLVEKDGEVTFRELPCPFLENRSCSVYEARPQECRSYPHLHREDFATRLFGVLADCSVCPIAFNVYEALKNDLPVEQDLYFLDQEGYVKE